MAVRVAWLRLPFPMLRARCATQYYALRLNDLSPPTRLMRLRTLQVELYPLLRFAMERAMRDEEVSDAVLGRNVWNRMLCGL